jgi:2'-5' RNA ligase
VRQCQDKLAGLAGLDLVPTRWLHMTTQIVGFADEISDAETTAMVAGTSAMLAELEPVEVELGKVWFHSEAVMLGIRPARALDPVREAIRASVAASVRVHQLADEPQWTPHISIAYSNSDGPAAPVIAALGDQRESRPLRVGQVHLVEQVRGDRSYHWEQRVVVRLGV